MNSRNKNKFERNIYGLYEEMLSSATLGFRRIQKQRIDSPDDPIHLAHLRNLVSGVSHNFLNIAHIMSNESIDSLLGK